MTALVLAMLAAAPKVASPEWTVVNLKRELVVFYADSLAQALRQEGLEVVASQDIATLLGMERQRQLLACNEGVSCMAELASALGCEATLTVNLVRFEDGGFRGLAKVIDSRGGQVLSSAKLDASSERALLEAIERSAHALAAPLLLARPAVATPVASGGSRRWWLLPAGLTVAAAATGTVLFVLASGDARALDAQTDFQPAHRLANDGALTQRLGWVSMGLALAAALATTGVLVFGSSGELPMALVPAPGGLLLAGRW